MALREPLFRSPLDQRPCLAASDRRRRMLRHRNAWFSRGSERGQSNGSLEHGLLWGQAQAEEK